MTETDGTGISYAAGSSFMMGSSDVVLYAVWIPTTVTFTSSGTSIQITGITDKLTPPTGSLAIPPGVTAIGRYAFYLCIGLMSVAIPSSVTSIGESAFEECTALKSIIIPSSVTAIGDEVFSDCSALISISVDSANPGYASSSGILMDKAMTTVLEAPGGISGAYSIPASVSMINWFAFSDCEKLTSVTIPPNVTSIGDDAFAFCSALTSVTMESSIPPSLPISLAFDGEASGFKIHVPSAVAVGAYDSATGWYSYVSEIVTP
jgi:hypothetical protein